MKRVGLGTVIVLLVTGLLADAGSTEAVRVPDTLADRRAVSSAPVVTDFPIDYVAVVWDGTGAGHDEAAVRFRHDGSWGAWQALEEDGAQRDGQFGSALVSGNDADAYQVRGVPPGARHPVGVALNTTDGPLIEVGRQRRGAALATPACRSRTDWGADESLMRWAPEYHSAQVLTVHHTDTTNNDRDPAATVRAIYRYHAVDRGWGDIGYQYLVDRAGVVYEGRASGSSRSCLSAGGDGSDFGHDDDGKAVTAAHVSGMNSGNLGVALLGRYTTVLPPRAQRSALEDQLADLARRHGIDPTRLDFPYVNPVSGATKNVATISGHRDWLATECPGGELYAQLASIRAGVAARLADGTTPPSTSTTTTSTTTTAADLGLTANGYKEKGIQYAALSWTGATAAIDVVRNDDVVVTATPNDGAHIDRIGKGSGQYRYRVCETGTLNCSVEVTVVIG